MMKGILFIASSLLFIKSYSQDTETILPDIEENAEFYAEREDSDLEDDSDFLRMHDLLKFKMNLNFADEDMLRELPYLTEILIIHFLEYRKNLGLLTSIYELQAVPGWTPELILKLLPYITISEELNIESLNKNLKNGDHSILIRTSFPLNKKSEQDSSAANSFLGSENKVLLRYRYKAGKNFQYGFLGEKDAGESIEFRNKKPGMDFLSWHVFLRNNGRFKQIAIGDYTLNFGQGLIQWQSLSFAKSAEITSVKKQSEKIRPYTSAGEFNFHRGAAVNLQFNRINLLLFYSSRNLSANISDDSVTTIHSFGMHRTEKELAGRGALNMKLAGFSTGYRTTKFGFNINGLRYQFSYPLTKQEAMYNLFAIRNSRWTNLSIDYFYTYKNIHLFGEVASDQLLNNAWLHGALLSLHQNVDVSLLYRNISPEYQSMFNTAFTENSRVNNEEGFFMGMSLRPYHNIRIDAFFDVFVFPWLKYRVDLPSRGSEQMIKLSYRPSRGTEIYFRYLNREKMINSGSEFPIAPLEIQKTTSFRSNLNLQLSKTFGIRNRLEIIRYKATEEENGFLMYIEMVFSPLSSPLKWNFRIQYHQTDGYNSRIYAFETDLPGSSRVIANSGSGFKFYFNMRAGFKKIFKELNLFSKDFQIAIRPVFTIHPKKEIRETLKVSVGGLGLSELKFQLNCAL